MGVGGLGGGALEWLQTANNSREEKKTRLNKPSLEDWQREMPCIFLNS